jgi:hypothetical protein
MPPLSRNAASDDQWPDGDPVMAALAEDLRIVASGPAPEPRPGLVALMAGGGAVEPAPQPRRPKMLVKTVLGSLAAKVALGVGVAAASVTAVGATGVLPDQAQHAVASVVSATTPFVLPDPSTERPHTVDDPTEATTTTITGATGNGAGGNGAVGTGAVGTGTVGDDPAGHDPADNHGACVSAAAQDTSGTGSHGKTVSSVARSDCGKVATTSTTLVTTSTTVPNSTTSSTSTTVAGTSRVSNAGPGSANAGKGNGSDKAKDDASNASNGKGNDGNGSSSAKD